MPPPAASRDNATAMARTYYRPDHRQRSAYCKQTGLVRDTWIPHTLCCSVRRTYRSECQCWVKGVAPDNFDPKFRKQQPCSITTHRFISCNVVFTPDEEGGPVISSRKCGKPRALCSRVQLQVPLDCSRSTLNNHNLAGKKEKELGSQSAMSNEEEAKSAVSTSHCLWEQVSDT